MYLELIKLKSNKTKTKKKKNKSTYFTLIKEIPFIVKENNVYVCICICIDYYKNKQIFVCTRHLYSQIIF